MVIKFLLMVHLFGINTLMLYELDLGQKKVPFGMEETTSSSKLKAIERSAVNRQFAEQLEV